MTAERKSAAALGQGRPRGAHSEATKRGDKYNTPRHRLELLNRLDGLRETGPDQWRARCPAHGSRGLTLSLKDTGDRLLMNCFAGCAPADILAAVGLELADLFDTPTNTGPLPHRDRLRVNPRDVLAAIRADLFLLAVCVQDAVKTGQMDDTTRKVIAEISEHLLAASEVSK